MVDARLAAVHAGTIVRIEFAAIMHPASAWRLEASPFVQYAILDVVFI